MLYPYQNRKPQLHPTARVADNATLIGAVTADADVGVWFGAVLRGDHSPIRIGQGSNIQDNCVLHGGELGPIAVGRDVTVGHSAILHCCTIEDGCIIGMGAIVMDGAVVGAGSMVAAGALVTRNTVIPPASLVIGSPAKVVRTLTAEEVEANRASAATYRALAAEELPAAQKGPQP